MKRIISMFLALLLLAFSSIFSASAENTIISSFNIHDFKYSTPASWAFESMDEDARHYHYAKRLDDPSAGNLFLRFSPLNMNAYSSLSSADILSLVADGFFTTKRFWNPEIVPFSFDDLEGLLYSCKGLYSEIECQTYVAFIQAQDGILTFAYYNPSANDSKVLGQFSELISTLQYNPSRPIVMGNQSTKEESEKPAPTQDQYIASMQFESIFVGVKKYQTEFDQKGKKRLLVCFDFSHTKDEATSANGSVRRKAFQDGIELDYSYASGSNLIRDIKKGATLEVWLSYNLASDSPVELEFSESFNYKSKQKLEITIPVE